MRLFKRQLLFLHQQAHPLQGQAVLHKDAGLRGDRGGQGDDERDGQPERVRAGNDEHGHRTHHGPGQIAGQPPHYERHERGGCGDVEQPRREAVREHLGPATGLLGLGDEALDAGQGGVVADRLDPDPDRRVSGDSAGHHPVADRVGNRPGLSGDH